MTSELPGAPLAQRQIVHHVYRMLIQFATEVDHRHKRDAMKHMAVLKVVLALDFTMTRVKLVPRAYAYRLEVARDA